MPTRRRRHAITETPRVQAALDELREEMGSDRLELGELVVLGARQQLHRLRADRSEGADLRRRLADRVRARTLAVDPAAAAEARLSGWTRS